MSSSVASPDLVWELVRNNNAYLVKRKSSGATIFSRDPLNLTNKHSRKYAGFVNEKAIGVGFNEKGGVKVSSKKSSAAQKPGSSNIETTHHGGKSARSTYKSVANRSAKSGYRPDLREAAISRVSAIRRSQRPVKPDSEPKLRGKKAREAAEKA